MTVHVDEDIFGLMAHAVLYSGLSIMCKSRLIDHWDHLSSILIFFVAQLLVSRIQSCLDLVCHNINIEVTCILSDFNLLIL